MFSVVIPVFFNEETIPRLVESLEWLDAQLPEPLETVFVVDGSPDRSFAVLRERLDGSPLHSELILLSKNFGSFAAIRAGMSVARGPHFAVLAADLQEPIELMQEFFAILHADEADVVLGQRTERNDPLTTRITSGLFWWFYRRVVQPEMPAGGVDVFACTRPVRDVLLRMDEANSSLVGQLVWLGFRQKLVPYVRQPRAEGVSSWTFRKRWNYMLNSIFSFTALPIEFLALTGFVGVSGSLLISGIVFVSWLAGLINVPGYTPIMLVILFSTSAILLGLGTVGSYVWRTFENSKRRPQAIVMLHESFPTGRQNAHADHTNPTVSAPRVGGEDFGGASADRAT